MVPETKQFKPLSDAITEPLRKAYVAGGFGLAILTLGAVLMLTAFFWQHQGIVRYVILATGMVLVFFTLAYVYFKELRRLAKAQATVKSNKEMFDTIQLTPASLFFYIIRVATSSESSSDACLHTCSHDLL